MVNRDEIMAAIIGIAAGIGLGLLSIGIAQLIITKCPTCGATILRNEPYCKNCSTILRWE